jgi:ferredoxin
MTHTVMEHCANCKYMDCVDVCPVSAFHESPERVYINPEECIDCDACAPECMNEAIVADEDLSDMQIDVIEFNREKCKDYPVIERKDESAFPPSEPQSDWMQ